MRRLALLAFLFSALSAQATWYPELSETYLVLHPGKQHTVDVTRRWSGITDYGFGGWVFASDNESVAVATGGVAVKELTGKINIAGRAPGVARIGIRDVNGRLYWLRITVAVIDDPVKEALYVAGPRTVRVGQRATFTTVGPDLSGGATVQWYAGPLGDTRVPVHTGVALGVEARWPGSSDFWVLVVTPRSLSTAAFSVTFIGPDEKLPPARRRAVRH